MTDKKNELPDLEDLRRKIDHVDDQLLALFNLRATIAQQVAKVKRYEVGDEGEPLFHRPEREVQILRRMVNDNAGPLSSDVIEHFFQEVMSSCLALQHPVKVSYLGPEGTFTQQATIKYFGSSVNINPCTTIGDVFKEVAAGRSNYGVVPVENSAEGFINHTLDNLFITPQKICGEVVLCIHHNLLVKNGNKGKRIEKIYAHSQALAQCRFWLQRNYPNVSCVATNSNGEAARIVSQEHNCCTAAIAGENAAQFYDLEIISRKIEDESNNSTRFLVLGNQEVLSTGKDKTSIIIVAPDKPGSLYKILAPFHWYGINLTKLESQPIRKSSWRYAFFIDFDGHKNNSSFKKALQEVQKNSMEIIMLGSYPKVDL